MVTDGTWSYIYDGNGIRVAKCDNETTYPCGGAAGETLSPDAPVAAPLIQLRRLKAKRTLGQSMHLQFNHAMIRVALQAAARAVAQAVAYAIEYLPTVGN
jgi:hypothetical protein